MHNQLIRYITFVLIAFFAACNNKHVHVPTTQCDPGWIAMEERCYPGHILQIIEDDARQKAADDARQKAEDDARQKAEDDARPKDLEEKGRRYAQESGTAWTLNKRKDEMEGIEIYVAVSQQGDAEKQAQVEVNCERGTERIIGKVTLIGALAPSSFIPYANITGHEGRRRTNDEPTVDNVILRKEFANVFEELLGWKQADGSLIRIRRDARLYLQNTDFVWRVLLQFNTTAGELVVKFPVYDQAIQSVIKSCTR